MKKLYPNLAATELRATPETKFRSASGENRIENCDSPHRLQEIARIRQQFEDERVIREKLYKKYHRGVNALDGVDTGLMVTSMGLGIGGVGLLSTIVAAPIVVGLEIAALVCGVLGISSKYLSRRLTSKAKKHDEIRVLAESKLNTVAVYISTALADGVISDKEFSLIVGESEKYRKMKAEIRCAAARLRPADIEKNLIQRGRDEARNSFIKKLAG